MHICKKIARKFTFGRDFLANGLHKAKLLRGNARSAGGVRRYNVSLYARTKSAFYNAAITSISTNPPLGSAATATAERAGNGAAKRVE